MAEPRQHKTSKRRHGLRVTVSLFGAVMSQKVWWPHEGPILVGTSTEDAVPTASGGPLLCATWRGRSSVELLGREPGVADMQLEAGDCFRWDNGSGVDVSIDLVPQQRARRRSEETFGDAALLTLMLMLMVGVGQAQFLWQLLMPEGGGPSQTRIEHSPEYIARLLDRDLEGADRAYARERSDRPEFEIQLRDEYMPAGSDGPRDRSGGGAAAGDEVRRERAAEEAGDIAQRPSPEDVEEEAEQPVVPEALELLLVEVEDAEPELEVLAAAEAAESQRAGRGGDASERRPDPVERFVGWGFRDWFDVADARRESVEELAWQLELVRERMRIDPDDPYALNLLGNYAYLAENTGLSRRSYQRYIELYPEDSLGYNNLALTHKRDGDYTEEERLYRAALELSPGNPNVLNNLAVNLAHQGQLEEALVLMEQLERLDPENPYTDLHRSKIYAVMGEREKAYRYLRRALEGAEGLSTLHHIEFRQDIRLEPAFSTIRQERRFARIIRKFYAEDAEYLIDGGRLGGDRG